MIRRKPTHPGTVFLEDVMKPLNLSVTETARMLGVSRKALSEFINEKSALSPEFLSEVEDKIKELRSAVGFKYKWEVVNFNRF